jgi:hypothetical protein
MSALQGIPVDRITTQAHQIHFTRTMLTIIGGILFGAGWIAARVAGVIWFALAWCVVAVQVGWVEGSGRKGLET